MKNKTWALLLGGLFLICLALSLWLMYPAQSSSVEIWSDGSLVETIFLSATKSVTVRSQWGTNVVTVRDGKVAVTDATCPDGYCMHRGWCSGGMQIVCLPNRLVIRFVGASDLDGIAG